MGSQRWDLHLEYGGNSSRDRSVCLVWGRLPCLDSSVCLCCFSPSSQVIQDSPGPQLHPRHQRQFPLSL